MQLVHRVQLNSIHDAVHVAAFCALLPMFPRCTCCPPRGAPAVTAPHHASCGFAVDMPVLHAHLLPWHVKQPLLYFNAALADLPVDLPAAFTPVVLSHCRCH